MEKYNFIHIPKTGGSTFRENISDSKLKVPVSMGHDIEYEDNSRNITFIRHPVGRTISHYNEMRNNTKKDLPFSVWFTEKYHDFQTKWLLDKIFNTDNLTDSTFEEIKNTLKEFFFIGITENLDWDLEVLFKKMKVSRLHSNTNIAKKKYVPFESDKELILSKCPYDLKLYKFVKNEKINKRTGD